MIVQELQLTGANGITTPGNNDTKEKMKEYEEELSPSDTTRYRATAARANYLVADKPDLYVRDDGTVEGYG